MRQSDRYNPPWERYTRTKYTRIREFVKRKTQLFAKLSVPNKIANPNYWDRRTEAVCGLFPNWNSNCHGRR